MARSRPVGWGTVAPSDPPGVYGRSLIDDPEIDADQIARNERMAQRLEELSNEQGTRAATEAERSDGGAAGSLEKDPCD